MKRLLALGVGVLAMLCLIPAQANASTLADCLAKQHVCVAGDGRSLVSEGQQAQLERQIGGDAIYLVVAASGSSGYDSAMARIIAALGEHPHFTVGFLDSRLRHFGAYNSGMLPPHGAAEIATRVVQQHQADQNIFAALTAFVTDVQQQAGPLPAPRFRHHKPPPRLAGLPRTRLLRACTSSLALTPGMTNPGLCRIVRYS